MAHVPLFDHRVRDDAQQTGPVPSRSLWLSVETAPGDSHAARGLLLQQGRLCTVTATTQTQSFLMPLSVRFDRKSVNKLYRMGASVAYSTNSKLYRGFNGRGHVT